MIETKFIEVSNGDLSDIGVDWAYLNENAKAICSVAVVRARVTQALAQRDSS